MDRARIIHFVSKFERLAINIYTYTYRNYESNEERCVFCEWNNHVI